ncbi:MAG: PilZ domain-containing protein [Kangiellaceae bacterium]|jgi:hypothetical protein|nr:PilZ domain-containing protein [Kangiellaceae bacterium]
MTIDKRQYPRKLEQKRLFIEVLANSGSEHDEGLVVMCSTKDISVNGLKVVSSYPMQESTILELLVDFDAGPDEQDSHPSNTMKYLLTGEVKWCEQVDSRPTFCCGFELLDAEHSDIKYWQELF